MKLSQCAVISSDFDSYQFITQSNANLMKLITLFSSESRVKIV